MKKRRTLIISKLLCDICGKSIRNSGHFRINIRCLNDADSKTNETLLVCSKCFNEFICNYCENSFNNGKYMEIYSVNRC